MKLYFVTKWKREIYAITFKFVEEKAFRISKKRGIFVNYAERELEAAEIADLIDFRHCYSHFYR